MDQSLFFEETALLYAAGALDRREQERFEAELAANPDWLEQLANLNDLVAAVALALPPPKVARPLDALQARVLGQVRQRMPSVVEKVFGITPDEAANRPLSVTDGRELVRWVSPAFSRLCGYSLEELRGHKLGHVLQGPRTDPAAVERLRRGIRARRPVTEHLFNYRKDGSCYLICVEITPITGNSIESDCFVARETHLADVDETGRLIPR